MAWLGIAFSGFTEFTGFSVHNDFMDVKNLGVVHPQLPPVAEFRFMVTNDGGEFDKHGTGRLQQGVQR